MELVYFRCGRTVRTCNREGSIDLYSILHTHSASTRRVFVTAHLHTRTCSDLLEPPTHPPPHPCRPPSRGLYIITMATTAEESASTVAAAAEPCMADEAADTVGLLP